MSRRHITHFRSRDLSYIYEFPLLGGEYEEVSELETPIMNAVGMSGAVDLLGYSRAIKRPRIIAVRGILSGEDTDEIDNSIESMLSTLEMIGRGTLLTSKGHWTPARFITEPENVYLEGQHLYMPYTAMFRADEDWYGETQETVTHTITATPQTFVVNNPGTIPALLMEIEFRGTASGAVTSISLINLNNGYQIGTLRDLNGTAQRVLIKTSVPSMEYSADSGGTWAADWANRVIGSLQTQFMILQPGDNTIQVTTTGVATGTVIFRFYPPYRT